MYSLMKQTFIIFLSLIISSLAYSKTLYVPSQYTKIQEAVDAASYGDIIEVADGTYKGEGNININIPRNKITLQSANGPFNCILDCENEGRAFLIENNEKYIVIDGFTILNGDESYGGAIFCSNSYPTIKNCVIKNNKASNGGGFYINNKDDSISVKIINCLFVSNTARGYGGGIFKQWGYIIVSNSNFIDNSSLSVTEHSGGIYTFTNRTIVNNSIFWNNTPKCIYRMNSIVNINHSFIDSDNNNLPDTCFNSCIFGNDPGFLLPEYKLKNDSPCKDSGSIGDDIPLTDIIGNNRKGLVDIGVFEYQQSYPGLKGDFNNDSYVGLSDVLSILQYILNGTPIIDNAKGDFTNDGKVDIFDAVKLVKYITQQIESL